MPLANWSAVRVERATAIACPGAHARTVEHLFAAAAALGLWRGLELVLEGDEVPILDGCAAEWMAALAPFCAGEGSSELVVAREDVIEAGLSRYAFRPSARTSLEVEVELGDPRLVKHASWDGGREDFAVRIATARTFCLAHEVEILARAGLASHVTPEMVVVLGPEILSAGRDFEPDEPARHKLLDLTGDLFLYGGPPRGFVSAHRPGHWSTHEAIGLALSRGTVVRV